MVLSCWEQSLREAHLGLRSCHGGKNLFLPKHWASPISWRLKTMLQNNGWFHQMYRELKTAMFILLDKQSRRTERETAKYINHRFSEGVSEKTQSFQETFFIIPKSHARQLWQISGWLFLPETTASYQKVSPTTGLHHQHSSKAYITPEKQVHHPQKPEGCVFDGHYIQSQWLVTTTTA